MSTLPGVIETLVEVGRICLPIFLIIALGRFLVVKGVFDADARKFCTWLVWNWSLPAIIFFEVARQDMGRLLNGMVIGSTIGVTLAIATVGTLLAIGVGSSRMKGAIAVAPFWANLSYLGFPLAKSAWGEDGLAYAAVVNAFTMPVFVSLGTGLLTVFSGRGGASLLTRIRGGILNPVVLASAAGLIVAWGRALFASTQGQAEGLLPVVDETLILLGAMGLPLALICVGSELDIKRVSGSWTFLVYGTIGKLIITPGLVYLLWLILAPQGDPAARGVAVMLMATPTAVGAYVVSRHVESGSEELSALLVVSTLASCITLPLWLIVLT